MALIKKISLFIIISLLILLTLLAVGICRHSDMVAEYLLPVFTDYKLQVDGGLVVQYSQGWLSLLLHDGRLLTKQQHEDRSASGAVQSQQKNSFLVVEDLQLRFKLTELIKANWVLDDIKASGLQLVIERNPHSETFKLPFARSDFSPLPDDELLSWQWQLGKIAITDAELIIRGYGEQQILALESIQLTGFDTERTLSVTGHWNNYPLSVAGKLEHGLDFLKANPYADKSFQLDLQASLAGILLGVAGSVAEQSSDLKFALNTEDFSLLSQMVGFELPDLGVLDFSGRLNTSVGSVAINTLSLSVTGQDLALTLKGDIARLKNDYQAKLTWALKADDLSELDIQERYPLLSGWQLETGGAIHYADNQAKINALTLRANSAREQWSLATKKMLINQRHWRQFDTSMSDGLLSYAFSDGDADSATTTSATLFSERYWQYQYPFESISVSLNANKHLKFNTRGSYKKLPLALTGQWFNDARYQLAGTLDDAVINVDGYLKQEQLKVVAKLKAPSLSVLSALFDRPLISVNSADIVVDILIDDSSINMKKFDLLLRKEHARIAVQGSIDDIKSMDDYRLDVTMSSASIVGFSQWLADNDDIIENTVSAFTHVCSLASQVDNAGCQQSVVPMQWLSDTVDSLDVRHWLSFTNDADGHLLASFSVGQSDSALFVLMPEISLHSQQLTVDWQGELIERAEGFSLQGEVSANASQSVIKSLETDIALTAKLKQRGTLPLQLTQLKLAAGQTQLAADLALQINDGELQAINGQLDFKRLDLRPYLPEKATTDHHGKSKADPEIKRQTQSPAIKTVIPELTLDLSWLPSQVVDLDVSVVEFIAPGLQLNNVIARVVRSEQYFEVNPFSAMLGGAPLRGRLALTDDQSDPQLAIFFEGLKLPVEDSQLLRDLKLVKSGRLDILVDLSSRGLTLRDLLAAMDGRISLASHEIIMNGSDLDQIAPGFITEVNQRINPFSRKKNQDTEIECGLIHFDINNGLMTANKSIVLVTPNISFGAHGAIDFNNESMHFQLVPRRRKGLGLSFTGNFAKMAVVSGFLYEPKIVFDPVGAITSSGIDVAGTVLYGPLYWLYLGQAQKLLASAKACDRAINEYAPELDSSSYKKTLFEGILPGGWQLPIESWSPF